MKIIFCLSSLYLLKQNKTQLGFVMKAANGISNLSDTWRTKDLYGGLKNSKLV